MTPHVILENPPGDVVAFTPYGGGRALWQCRAPEAILSGPSETGKTRTSLEKLDGLCWKYPGVQCAIVRKTRASMTGSVLQTFEKKVLSEGSPVTSFGGEHVEWYDYPNGSRIFVGGMDRPDKVLSSERDFIYVNQAEELTLDDWETLTTRTTGRAGNAPYAQIFGDCNPGGANHWILKRTAAGDLVLLESRHEDNPTLFDPATGAITEQGRRSLATLDKLTGVRYQRLRKGKWATAEGAVYEDFDRAVHVIDPFPVPPDWIRIRAIDFGFTNPFVCQWWAIDGDGRLYLYREIYHTRRLVEDHARDILELEAGQEWITATVADHDAEDRATLERHGVRTTAAKKAVSTGIQAVQARLKLAGDGRPRIFVMRGALVEADPALLAAHKPTCTEQEWDTYLWQKTGDGRPNKEQPSKVDDHGMDCTRYAAMWAEALGGDAPEAPCEDRSADIPDFGGWSDDIPGL